MKPAPTFSPKYLGRSSWYQIYGLLMGSLVYNFWTLSLQSEKLSLTMQEWGTSTQMIYRLGARPNIHLNLSAIFFRVLIFFSSILIVEEINPYCGDEAQKS